MLLFGIIMLLIEFDEKTFMNRIKSNMYMNYGICKFHIKNNKYEGKKTNVSNSKEKMLQLRVLNHLDETHVNRFETMHLCLLIKNSIF